MYPKPIQAMFDLHPDAVAVEWDGIEPMLIVPYFESEQEMTEGEFVFDSPTYLAFEDLWSFFYGMKPIRYDRG